MSKYSEYYFVVEFPTCNSFRQILEFLNQSHKVIPLIFSKNNFSIRKPNDKGTILFDGVISSYNLTEYYIDESILRKVEEDDEPEFYIHIPIGSLLTLLKRIQKKQTIKISQKKGRENFITIQSEESSSMSSEIIIEPSKDPPASIKLYESISVENPNITMQLSGFHFSATGSGRISDRISKIQVFKRGVKILSSSAQGDSLIQKGDCVGEYICEIKVSGDVMRSISKLASLCDEGIVRVYCNNESYIRLEIPISVIGTAYIYLFSRDFSE